MEQYAHCTSLYKTTIDIKKTQCNFVENIIRKLHSENDMNNHYGSSEKFFNFWEGGVGTPPTHTPAYRPIVQFVVGVLYSYTKSTLDNKVVHYSCLII